MADVLVWWLVVEIVGLAALPVAWRLFSSLPDRGYAFAKPLGIFLVSYILWILAIFGIVKNSRGTAIFIVATLGILSWWWVTRRPVAVAVAATATPPPATRSRRVSATNKAPARHAATPSPSRPALPEIVTWLRDHARIIAIEESILLIGLIIWAAFKAYNPEIVATEKPMEFAFLTAILRSDQFPPLDPWLSGYSISYYYLGYVMMAMLTRLSGIAPSVAYNLTLVLSFALTLTGAFSIVYNLAARRAATLRSGAAVAAGVLGSFLVAVAGNLQGLLEFFYAHGMGSVGFWKFIGIADMQDPYKSTAWYPTANWWWWKASRVIGTKGVIGDYTINEFPFFSFMLGDNHPHVLALPYVLMALGLGMAILMRPQLDLLAMLKERSWIRLLGAWALPAVLLGGLFFLNSWDFPTYSVIVILACALRVYRDRQRLDLDAIKEMALFAVPVMLLGVFLYLPFYMSFESQAAGFGVVRVRSQIQQWLIIFGPFMLMATGFLAIKIQEWRSRPEEEREHGRSLLLPLVIIGVIAAAAMIALQLWTTVTTLLLTSLAGVLVSLLLLAFIVLALVALATHARADLSDVFVIILAGVGAAVILLPEWIHINDNFGGDLSRMNTVFKFFYQGWILLALVSAYSIYYTISHRPAGVGLALSLPRSAFVMAAVLLMLAAGVYPVMAFYTKANEFQGTPTLDGMAYMKTSAPEDYNAIQWINTNIKSAPVIVEAVGGEYSEFARISTHTGLPAVIGWPGHEGQWRKTKGWEGREGDVNRIYATTDINEAKALLKKYNVTYVFVGRLERGAADANGKPKYDATALGKFATFMDVVYQQGNTTIYRVRQ